MLTIAHSSSFTSEIPNCLSLQELEKIVTEVRMLFENHHIDRQILQSLYQVYNSQMKNLELFVKRAEYLFPYLNCGLTTVYLREILKTGEIIKGKYDSNDHTFLLLENFNNKMLIVDITADQYGGPSIYVGVLQMPWKCQ